MPTVNHTGVSRKISSEEERQRLKRIIISERENGHGGFIVRTAAQGASEEELRADIRFLKDLWNEIKTRADNGKAPDADLSRSECGRARAARSGDSRISPPSGSTPNRNTNAFCASPTASSLRWCGE